MLGLFGLVLLDFSSRLPVSRTLGTGGGKRKSRGCVRPPTAQDDFENVPTWPSRAGEPCWPPSRGSNVPGRGHRRSWAHCETNLGTAPKYLVKLLFSFRGVSEVEVPAERIRGNK